MNKMQLITNAARETNCTIKQTEEILTALLNVISTEMEKDDGKVHISGFGTIEVREHAARRARNPKTGETLLLDSRKYIQFIPSHELKDKLK